MKDIAKISITVNFMFTITMFNIPAIIVVSPPQTS